MMPLWRSMKLFPSIKNFLPRLAATLALGAALLATSPISANASNAAVSASPDKRYDGLLAPQERSAQPRKARMQTAHGPKAPRPKHLGESKQKARDVAEPRHVFGNAPEISRPHCPLRLSSRACAWSWLARAPPEFFS
jgi:hypothetical protein